MMPRVVVTGTGLVTAFGRGVRPNVEALYDGKRPLAPEQRLPCTLRDPALAYVSAAATGEPLLRELGPLAERLVGRPLVRTSELALLALQEALAQAGWARGFGAPTSTQPPPERIGVCVGTTVGCAFDAEEYYRSALSGTSPEPAALAAYLANDLATVLATAAGVSGARATVVNACASSADAIGLARRWLLRGECDAVVCGGADALHRFPYLGFGVLKNTSSAPCRPFDKNRCGLNLGDGAGLLVLEREADALARGTPILGAVAGYATTADAHHLTAPHPDGLGLRDALTRALADAQLANDAIGFAHAHGTGTSHNDRVEGRALADRFGTDVVVFSTKGYTGHTLGAAGALGAIFTLEHLRDGRVPASAGFETPDPECIVVPTRQARPVAASAAVTCSLAFGGTNSVLVLERADARTEAAS